MTAVWTISALVLGLMMGGVAGFVIRRRSDYWCRQCGHPIGHHCAACAERHRTRASLLTPPTSMATPHAA